MTEIGLPDPLEPEIDVIPSVDPVPAPLEIPAPAATRGPSATRHDPHRADPRVAHLARQADDATSRARVGRSTATYGRRGRSSPTARPSQPAPACGCGVYAVTTRERALEWAEWARPRSPTASCSAPCSSGAACSHTSRATGPSARTRTRSNCSRRRARELEQTLDACSRRLPRRLGAPESHGLAERLSQLRGAAPGASTLIRSRARPRAARGGTARRAARLRAGRSTSSLIR